MSTIFKWEEHFTLVLKERKKKKTTPVCFSKYDSIDKWTCVSRCIFYQGIFGKYITNFRFRKKALTGFYLYVRGMITQASTWGLGVEKSKTRAREGEHFEGWGLQLIKWCQEWDRGCGLREPAELPNPDISNTPALFSIRNPIILGVLWCLRIYWLFGDTLGENHTSPHSFLSSSSLWLTFSRLQSPRPFLDCSERTVWCPTSKNYQ